MHDIDFSSKKSPSIESLISNASTVEDLESLESSLFDAIDHGDLVNIQHILTNSNHRTALLQILLTKTKSNQDAKYSFDVDIIKEAHELLGPSLENLHAIQISCILGEEEISMNLLNFILDATSFMDAKKLLYEFLGRTCGHGNTILHLASFMGMSELVAKLIHSGASIHKKNHRNYKPVDLADDEETRLIFMSLQDGKFNANNANTHNAKEQQRELKEIDDKEIQPQIQTIHHTVKTHTIDKPKRPRRVQFDIETILLDMCQNGFTETQNLETFRQFCHQIDLNSIHSPQKNMTLLHVACSYGQLELVREMLSTGNVLINAVDLEGWTPLHCAVAEGDLEIIQLLAKTGKIGDVSDAYMYYVKDGPMSLDALTDEGETAKDLAIGENSREILTFLQEIEMSQPNSTLMHQVKHRKESYTKKNASASTIYIQPKHFDSKVDMTCGPTPDATPEKSFDESFGGTLKERLKRLEALGIK